MLPPSFVLRWNENGRRRRVKGGPEEGKEFARAWKALAVAAVAVELERHLLDVQLHVEALGLRGTGPVVDRLRAQPDHPEPAELDGGDPGLLPGRVEEDERPVLLARVAVVAGDDEAVVPVVPQARLRRVEGQPEVRELDLRGLDRSLGD